MMRVTGWFCAIAMGLAPMAVTAQQAPMNSGQSVKASRDPEALLLQAKDQMRGNPSEAVRIATQAEAAIRSRMAPPESAAKTAEALWLQGEGLLRLSDADAASERIERALTLLSGAQSRSLLRGELLLTRGGVATAKANVSEALADYQNAHNIFRTHGELRKQAIALRQIASLYREAGDLKTAMRYDEQSIEIYQNDPALEVTALNNKGNALDQEKQFLKAELEYRRALNIAKKMGSKVYQSSILRNIARVQIESGKFSAARTTLALAESYDPRNQHSPVVALRAQLLYQEGDTLRAAELINRYFRGVDLKKTGIDDRDSHSTAFEVSRALGKYDLALSHLEALKRLDDKTASLTASANTALMSARFDYANQNAKIANLKAEEAKRKFEFEQARGRLLRWIFFGVIIASAVIVSMLAFGLITIRRSRNEVRAANVELAGSNTALEKALAAKTEFLATTSHEIRTPLNGILGMTQVMLADRGLTGATRDRLDVVHAAGVTMKALVDDILDVAKMETGNLSIESVPVDLHKTLNDVSRLWEEQARAKGVTFTLDLGNSPQLIQGDSARLRQVVFNLLSNALKFTAAGSITLRAELDGEALLRISVSDTGIGIPPDKLDVIFESFRQVDAATTRQFGGTGLGLSICRNLARAMGGDVSVQSTLGTGSTFAITLPYEPAAFVFQQALAGGVEADLLIVDRNPITRSMLKALFEPHVTNVAAAGSLQAAIDCLLSARPALLVVDDAVLRAEPDVEAALAALMAAAGDASVRLLWSNPSPAEQTMLAAMGTTVIAKPIAAMALVAALFPPSAAAPIASHDEHDLVSSAA